MNREGTKSGPPPDPEWAVRINRVCDAFEDCWRAEGRPRIEDFLGTVLEAERPALVGRLLQLEVGLARQDARDYAERFPEQAGQIADLLADEPVSAYSDAWTGRLRRRLRGNRTRTVASGAALFVAAIALVAWAVREDRRSREFQQANEGLAQTIQRLSDTNSDLWIANKRTQSRFVLALDAIAHFHRGMSEAAILGHPADGDLRARFLNSAQEFDRNLSAQAERERQGVGERFPNLEPQRALAAFRRLEGRRLEDEGRSDEALAAYNEAHELLRTILNKDPENRATTRDLATTLIEIGNIHYGQAHLEAALAAYSWARDLRRLLVSPAPNVRIARNELAESLTRIGLVLAADGREDQAIRPLEEARQILQNVVAAQPKNPDARENLAKADYRLALALQSRGRFDEALARMKDCLKLRQRLNQDRPQEPQYQNALALCWMSIGMIQREEGRREDAETAFVRAWQWQQPLAGEQPGVPKFRRDLSAILCEWSTLRQVMGRSDEALCLLEEARALRERLVREDPQQVLDQTDLADTLSNLGRIHAAEGRRSLALDSFRRAITIRRKVAGPEDRMLYPIACELAMSVPLLASPERDAAADEAMETLKRAVDRGDRDLEQLLADRVDVLAALRDRPDFEVLLMDLEFPASPFAP